MTTSWKQRLAKLESLTKDNGRNAWETAQQVRELWMDREFLDRACGGKLDEAESKLTKYSGRFGIGLNNMIQMIEHFPDQKDWESGRLDILLDKTCKAILAKKQPPQPGTRRSATLGDVAKLQRRVKQLQSRVRQLEAENERLKKELAKRDRGSGGRGKAA